MKTTIATEVAGVTQPTESISARPVTDAPVVITGAALGLPGVPRVFDDENVGRILAGQQFIGTIPQEFREQMVDKHITRLVKPEDGDPTFVPIDDVADVIKLAGRHAPFDLVSEFGVEEARDAALDEVTRLAIGAGIDALRDAGIPLVMRYRTTTLGTKLPDRWGLPDALRDDTGVIFASAFPGFVSFAHDLRRHGVDRARRHELATLQSVREKLASEAGARADVDGRIDELERVLRDDPFEFDRRFLFRVLSMGHSQFAELIGARGPNTQLNAACASTTLAQCVAEDWIRTGRCRRVVIVSADDVTNDELLPWVTSGFLASGAAATDENVADAAIPFDRRRHGMIIGTGAAAIVVESAESAAERGIRPICEIARHGRREQRIPRHPARPGARRPDDATAAGRGRGSWRRPARDRTQPDVHVARDVHPRAGRQRLRGDRRAAPHFRDVGRRHRDRQHEGLHRPRNGRRHRGRRGDQVARDGHRSAGAELQGGRPRAGFAQPLEGRRVPGRVRAPAGGRIRLADRDDSAAPHPWPGERPAGAGPARLPVPDCRRGRLARLAGRAERPAGSGTRGRPASAARRGSRTGAQRRRADPRAGRAGSGS